MALRDHSLDDKITEAAMAEFMEHGFQRASMRQIAARAGLSTGALYTRYKNKDLLFCSLVEGSLKEIAAGAEPIRETYAGAQALGSPKKLMEAIKREEEMYLGLMFRYYDQCVLFFCRSDGSSIQEKINLMMEEKAGQTVKYLKSLCKDPDIDFDGINFILSEQFYYYRKILEKGFSREKALSCMRTVEEFMEAGWKALFERIM